MQVQTADLYFTCSTYDNTDCVIAACTGKRAFVNYTQEMAGK